MSVMPAVSRCLMLLALGGIMSLCVRSEAAEASHEPIKIGSKNFTEGVVLSEILTRLAEAKGIEAVHRSELGGTQIVFQALEKGEIDAYTDYTGTIGMEILSGERARDEDQMREALRRRGIGMSGRLGFNNTYAMGMKEELAERLGIRTVSDLARLEHAKLRLGFSEEFISRNDGWEGLRRTYGLTHKPATMDHSLSYRGIEGGSIDVTDLYSTDAEVRFHRLRLLEDDKGYFPSYYCVVLYRLDLNQRAPQFVEAIKLLEGQIDNAEMIELNSRAKLDRMPEAEVAAEFLHRRLGLNVAVPRQRWYADLWLYTWQHLLLVGASLAGAVVVAIPLGIWASRHPQIGQAILGTVGILQTLPSLAILVFMVPLLGLGPLPAIVALFIYSLLPIVRNTYTGLTQIPPNLQESAAVLGLPARARLWLIELPLASPSILAGIKTAAVINVGTATIGALIGAGGYGRPILSGIRLADTSLILQGAVPAALMALTVQALFELAERYVVPKGLRLKSA
jgi:osmoprotectant transport system permease protein